MRQRTTLPALVVAGVAALALTGCSTGSGPASSSGSDKVITVVASTNVYGGIVKTIGGDRVDVTSILTDPSQDPHSFEASSRTQLAVSKADVLVENGGGYDDYMDTLRKSSNSDATLVNVVKLSGLQKPGEDDFNEHVFYRYPTMVTFVDTIERDLAKVDPSGADTFTRNADALKTKLQKLEDETAALEKEHGGEKVAYTEPVPGYLFDAAGLVNSTPEAFAEAIEEGDDVPPAALNDTLKLFTGKDAVKLLAYNNQASSPETKQVEDTAEKAGIPVIGVTETLPEGKDYVSWQQGNIDAISAALGG
jgi:zinc/manganese transport system substrate-binding protein